MKIVVQYPASKLLHNVFAKETLIKGCVSSYPPKQCPSLRYSSSQSFVFYFHKPHWSYTHYHDDNMHCDHSSRFSLSIHHDVNLIMSSETQYFPDFAVDTFQSRDYYRFLFYQFFLISQQCHPTLMGREGPWL